MFRYTINSGDRGGCVLAYTEDEALAKVKVHYLKLAETIDDRYWKDGDEVTVWMENSFPSDINEVYP